MANATALTLTDLVGNAGVAAPTADVFDTGTAAVTVPLAAGGKGLDRIILEVTNTAVAALKVEVLAGDYPPAGRSGLGDLVLVAALAQNGVQVCGPFEGGRFAQVDGATKGRLDIKLTPASGTLTCNVRAYRLPKTV